MGRVPDVVQQVLQRPLARDGGLGKVAQERQHRQATVLDLLDLQGGWVGGGGGGVAAGVCV